MLLIRFCEIEENYDRRIADGRVMAGKAQATRFGIHAEDGEIVAALITGVKEPAGGVEIEAPRIVTSGPFLPGVSQGAGDADGKYRDAVVQTVAGI